MQHLLFERIVDDQWRNVHIFNTFSRMLQYEPMLAMAWKWHILVFLVSEDVDFLKISVASKDHCLFAAFLYNPSGSADFVRSLQAGWARRPTMFVAERPPKNRALPLPSCTVSHIMQKKHHAKDSRICTSTDNNFLCVYYEYAYSIKWVDI